MQPTNTLDQTQHTYTQSHHTPLKYTHTHIHQHDMDNIQQQLAHPSTNTYNTQRILTNKTTPIHTNQPKIYKHNINKYKTHNTHSIPHSYITYTTHKRTSLNMLANHKYISHAIHTYTTHTHHTTYTHHHPQTCDHTQHNK